MLPELTLPEVKASATHFARTLHTIPIPELYGATDGKAVGTFVEQMFRQYLAERYTFIPGNAANGIDLPDLEVDLKATSYRQPQSSCPFRDASQKVYGLGYHLLIFVYDKKDDTTERAARLNIQNVIFVEKEKTGDWQSTKGIIDILNRSGNKDDLVAFLEERNFPLDEIGRVKLAERILQHPPMIGYLTISNALQWRLQYGRAINAAIQGNVEGVENLYV
ncbi:MAG: restriction endonuclease [Ktedonobacteraceae bacterium]|nr:restriction endonuclease [Ktedonobacteraceae bacterium]